MEQSKTSATFQHINKTLFTARIMDGFWDRFIVHGVDRVDIAKIRPTITSQENWICGWGKLAHEKVVQAIDLQKTGSIPEAEQMFRTAGLYFQLAQWLLTDRSEEKAKWLEMSINVFRIADKLSSIQTKYETIKVDNYKCFGRVRIPSNPKGVVVIINPFDSTKEELFTYEMDYASNGFITVSFDGPGQGETFVKQGLKATHSRWKTFVDSLIDFAAMSFPKHKIFLFGTSSGAAWTVYGSTLPQVTKAVAVSPAFLNDNVTLPDYFLERIDDLTDSESIVLPNFENLNYRNPVFLVHGKKDLMVTAQNIYDLYEKLPQGKKLLEYENEGHCCNYKLRGIREISMGWFIEGEEKAMNINEFRQLISEVTNMPVDTITPQASFKDDLAIDSLQLVNLVIEVSGRLKSDLKNIQSLKDISTVQGFYNLLQEV